MSDSMPPRCRGLFGRRLCKWEGRYDEKPIVVQQWPVVDTREEYVYVRDICASCGQTKERAI